MSGQLYRRRRLKLNSKRIDSADSSDGSSLGQPSSSSHCNKIVVEMIHCGYFDSHEHAFSERPIPDGGFAPLSHLVRPQAKLHSSARDAKLEFEAGRDARDQVFRHYDTRPTYQDRGIPFRRRRLGRRDLWSRVRARRLRWIRQLLACVFRVASGATEIWTLWSSVC